MIYWINYIKNRHTDIFCSIFWRKIELLHILFRFQLHIVKRFLQFWDTMHITVQLGRIIRFADESIKSFRNAFIPQHLKHILWVFIWEFSFCLEWIHVFCKQHKNIKNKISVVAIFSFHTVTCNVYQKFLALILVVLYGFKDLFFKLPFFLWRLFIIIEEILLLQIEFVHFQFV